MPRTIVLTLAPPNSNPYGSSEYWSVSEDGRICDGLCWDEMLGVVVRLTQSDTAPRMPMLTIDEHKERAKKRAPRPRTVDALAQLLDAMDGNKTAGPLLPAIEEAKKAIAEERDLEIPF